MNGGKEICWNLRNNFGNTLKLKDQIKSGYDRTSTTKYLYRNDHTELGQRTLHKLAIICLLPNSSFVHVLRKL